MQSLTTYFFVRDQMVIDAWFSFFFCYLFTWYVLTFILVSFKNQRYVKFRHFESQSYFISSYDMKTHIWKEILWDFLLLINLPTTPATLVSPSFAASCTYFFFPRDASPVTGVPSYSVYLSYYGWVTGYYSFSESMSVPDLKFPVPSTILVASELTII